MPAPAERVDKLVSSRHGISRRHAQELIEQQRVTLGGRPVRKNLRLEPGEAGRLAIDWPPAPGPDLKPENIPLEIIYEDGDIAVIDKPPGLACHPYGRRTTGTLVNALLFHFGALSAAGGAMRPGIVHRLDSETSGLLIVAKNDASHRFLSEEFRSRRVEKHYTAFVKGTIPWNEQRINLHLNHSRRNWRRMNVGFVGGRESITCISVVSRFAGAAETLVRPLTGRTHQIRVVLYFLGFPIIGDKLYGTREQVDGLIDRHALHATELSFRHPRNLGVMRFSSSLPADLARLKADLTAVRL